jgi:hypothetical protein
MTQAGPQRYPGADQTHRYQSAYPGDAMEVNVIVLHTTEGRTLPTYSGGAVAPNLTAVPDFAAHKLKWYQHFDIDTSSRALVNLAGGVETNTLNVCQVEMVGTCDPHTHAAWAGREHIYWPEAPDWALAEVAAFLRWMHDNHGVPLSGPALWLPYPSSYGSSKARMTNAQWSAFKGICGHQHAAENVHGDPGAIDFARLIALAKGDTQEEDMPLTADDVRKVWTTDGIVTNPNPVTAEANPYIAPATGLRNIEIITRRTEATLATQGAAIAELTKTVAALAANTADIDPDALVARIQAAIDGVTIHLDTTP